LGAINLLDEGVPSAFALGDFNLKAHEPIQCLVCLRLA